MDQEIANTFTVEDEIEAEIVESAAIKEGISDKISLVKRTLGKLTTPTIPTTSNVSAAEFLPPPQPSMKIPVTEPITYPATTRPSMSQLLNLACLPSLETSVVAESLGLICSSGQL